MSTRGLMREQKLPVRCLGEKERGHWGGALELREWDRGSWGQLGELMQLRFLESFWGWSEGLGCTGEARSVLPEDCKAEGPKDERPLQVEALPRLHVVVPHKDEQQVDQSYGK